MSQTSFDFPLRPAPSPAGLRAPRVTPAHRLAWVRAARAWSERDTPSPWPPEHALEAVGFEIGRDHAHHGLVPPSPHLVDGHPVRAGWEIGRACFGRRTLKATPAVQAWLALRLQAWAAGIAFDACHVTPHLMERLHPAHCPITREPLAPLGHAGSGQVDRLRRAGAYGPGNLLTLDLRAVEARTETGLRQAIAIVEQLETQRQSEHQGLSITQWARLAVLESFATALPHDEAARLPLLLLPPPRIPVINPAQALQVVITAQLALPGYARRLASLAAQVPSSGARHALQVFVHTLLARRVALGAVSGMALRHGLEDAWRHPLVNQRWQHFALKMTAAACERLAQGAVRDTVASGQPQVSAAGR